MWPTLTHWTRKSVEHYKQNFMGHPSRNVEDGSAKSNAQVKRFQRETILGAGLDPLPL